MNINMNTIYMDKNINTNTNTIRVQISLQICNSILYIKVKILEFHILKFKKFKKFEIYTFIHKQFQINQKQFHTIIALK